MSDNLGQFGKHFQEGLMRCLLTDARWAEQISEVFKPEYFELKHLQFLSEKYFAYSTKYRLYPSLNLLITIIRDDLKAKVGSDEVLCTQVIDFLKKTQTATLENDAPFIKDKSLDWCRKMALRGAIERAIDKMASDNYAEIADDIKKATMVGTTPSVGHDFAEDIESRFTPLQRSPISTGIKELDHKDILNGGLGKGELGVICAPTGVGKSHFLVMLGAEALLRKLNVVHYTVELSETMVGNRYDSYLCGVDFSNLFENKNKVVESYKGLDIGRLKIKYYPMNTMTVHMMAAHLERLSLLGFVPDLVIVDYADKIRSSREYDQLRMELTLVYEELRVLAIERGVPIWTASQSNKDGANNEIVDLGNMSEAYGKAQTADVVLGISRMSHEKALGSGRLYIAKNRAGRDGIVYPLVIDTAQSRFVVSGEKQTPEQTKHNDENAVKRKLKEKWQELENEKLVQERKVQEQAKADAVV